MSRYKYPTLNANESIEIKSGTVLRLACCDCGLVHRIAFVSDKKGNIGMAMERNNNSTTQLRRNRKFPFIKRGK